MSLGYWLIDTAGNGGIIVTVVFVSLLVVYVRILRWIHDGARVEGESDAHS